MCNALECDAREHRVWHPAALQESLTSDARSPTSAKPPKANADLEQSRLQWCQHGDHMIHFKDVGVMV